VGFQGSRVSTTVSIRCLDMSAPVPVEVQRPPGTGRQAPTKLTRSLPNLQVGASLESGLVCTSTHSSAHIGLDLVDRDLGRRARVVDGVQHLEESRGTFGSAGFGQGLDHPQRRMGVLAAVFPLAGDKPLT
jgi:hypothetical protein